MADNLSGRIENFEFDIVFALKDVIDIHAIGRVLRGGFLGRQRCFR
jgi:hypothetical protein